MNQNITAAIAMVALFFSIAPHPDRWMTVGIDGVLPPFLFSTFVYFALVTVARR